MPITDLAISLNETEEQQLTAQGFKKIVIDLNEGARGNSIYLWFKDEADQAVTRIQFSWEKAMETGLYEAGYEKINKNLNAGAGGACIYMWFYKGGTDADFPIKAIGVTTDATDEGQRVRFGWERLTCDLNKGAGGNWIYLWVQRERQVHIAKVTASSTYKADADLFQQGYIRVDDNTNKFVEEGRVFLWYLLTADKQQAIGDLKVSHNDKEYEDFQKQGYTPVNMDLNKGTGRNRVFLWHKKHGHDSIRGMGIITDRDVKPYKEAGATVILINQAGSYTFYLYFYR